MMLSSTPNNKTSNKTSNNKIYNIKNNYKNTNNFTTNIKSIITKSKTNININRPPSMSPPLYICQTLASPLSIPQRQIPEMINPQCRQLCYPALSIP
ncbi:hypothetical protein SAMD00019534_124540 [Acytostelium subglobosum LB1]|uniref:hypothetical protein n=1 Tax=Acytostelium subglobosum LB1 TaxID=1410327 RepID=UPI000645102A|nr:hypothetical protein SAMD00019534_124540 [Acytostelium subglobosum LB1]GAM29278.1 hypothetical protein SAMD00019534_124540 [Acytostelium subglobosum LB1]|eukprot:XP_012747776.1 hypothetical protein SAMD00019534_124540 [Acytostelium subglobosum LB1]